MAEVRNVHRVTVTTKRGHCSPLLGSFAQPPQYLRQGFRRHPGLGVVLPQHAPVAGQSVLLESSLQERALELLQARERAGEASP
jgi:hypothetical protein